MHKLLTRQLKKFFGGDTSLPEGLKDFVAAVSQSYDSFDGDQEMLHRAMELSSAELAQSNSELRAVFHAIPDLILRFDRSGNIVTLKATEKTDADPQTDRFHKRRISSSLSVIPDPAIREQFQHALRNILRDRQEAAFEYSTLSEFGETFFEVRLIPLMEEDAIAIIQDITKRKHTVAEHERLNNELIRASRQAGMAEVATGVLHNVGNVLNSVNVSASLLRQTVKASQIQNLLKATNLLRDHATDTAAFLTNDPKGQKLPGYLIKLGDHIASEQRAWQLELDGLAKNIEHIKEIVAMQQSYARLSGISECLNAAELVDDALRMNEASISRDGVTLVRNFQDVPLVVADKHKALQILVNLICNAKYAVEASGKSEKIITVSIQASGDTHVRILVRDTGTGIAPENLARIFQHGFTTKKDGHGFGLHSSANAAQEMGGSLRADSDGPGTGATFTLELPVANSSTRPASKSLHPAQPETSQEL